MSRQLLFVQGGGAGTHDQWDNHLVESLKRELGAAYEIRYPRMPDEDDPRFSSWKAALDAELAQLDDDAVLVGHSIGGTIIVSVLADEPRHRRFGALFLIATPFVGDGGWPADDMRPQHDLGARLSSGVVVHVFHGLHDDTAPPSHAELYRQALPDARVHLLPGRDHQLNNDLREVAAAIRSLEMEES